MDAAPELTAAEAARYARHLALPEVGRAGQRRLKGARVLVVGVGGLGSPAALYLAAAGVGTLGLVDADAVDASNLQRQLLYGTGDVGRPKLAAAADRLRDLNPHVALELHETRLARGNALDLVARYDVVVDGADNFPTRYLVNDACVLAGRPNVHGAVSRFEGRVSVFDGRRGPCYRCLFPAPPPPDAVPTCAEGGVLGVLPGVVGTLQATEALKLLLGVGEPLVGRLLLFDALAMAWHTLAVGKDPACPLCGERPTQRGLVDYEAFCGGPSRSADEAAAPSLTPGELAARLAAGDRPAIVDVREPHEWEAANLAPLGATLVPLATLAERMSELDPGADLVVHCRSGARGARAVRQLRAAGFTRVWNLDGGLLAWRDAVDPALPVD